MKTRSIYCILLSVLSLLTATVLVAADAVPAQSSWSRTTWQADPTLNDPLQQQGQEVFRARCQICHGEIPKEIVPGGLPPMPGTQALRARYKGEKPAVLEQRTDLTPDLIIAIVRNGINSMPYFRPTEVTNAELAALAAYLCRKKP